MSYIYLFTTYIDIYFFFKLHTYENIKHTNANLSVIVQFTNGLPE